MKALAKKGASYKFVEKLDQEYLSIRHTFESEEASLDTKIVMVNISEFRCVVKIGIAVETIKFKKPQLIPRSYEWVLGLIELRGESIPVIDIGAFNKQGITKIDQSSRLLIVRHGEAVYAILVSLVSSVVGVTEFFSLEEGCGVTKPNDSLIEFSEWVEVKNEKLCFLDLEGLEDIPEFLKITY